MKAILISIKPKFAEKILTGEKTVELRKVLPTQPVGKAYIYASAPVKRIVGEFQIKAFKQAAFCSMGGDILKRACVGYKYAFKYYGFPYDFERRPYIAIGKVTRYSEPIDPRAVMPGFTAPQSWYYADDVLEAAMKGGKR